MRDRRRRRDGAEHRTNESEGGSEHPGLQGRESFANGQKAKVGWRISRPTSRRRMILLVSIGLSGILGVADPVFGQAHDDYIYCTRTGGERYATWDTYYYTAVFLGDYSLTQGHENDFYDYLKDNAPEMYFVHSYCFSAGTRNEAEERLLRHMREDERNGYRVVRTNWTARASGSRTGGSFAASPIQDSRISVPASPYEVEVCVRDHECEDGDQVRVSVNGSAPLGGEIFNEWNCRSISLREGRHDMELYAVNGTGYKGNCSHIDGNTGEFRVTGEDSQTQSWRHRGGKGSKANIEVTVR